MTIYQIIGIIAGIIIIGSLLLCAIGEIKTGVCTTIIGVIMLLCAYIIDTKQIIKPTALDVYRGKTTLEVTYRDSVAVDSVVVYKMK